MATPTSSSAKSTTALAKRKKQDDKPKWVAPAAVGGGLLALGFLFFSRRASAATSDGSTPTRGEDDYPPDIDTDPSDDSNGRAPSDSSTPIPTPTPIPIPRPNPNGDKIVYPIYSGNEGRQKLWDIAEAAGLDDDWIRFFLMTARGESAFTSNVVLGDPALYPTGSKPSSETARLGPGEASGARRAYQRGFEENRYVNCTWPKEAYSWGSGGWLQMLPANAWAAYNKTGLRCRHPWYVLHPVDHVVTAIEFARRLTGWSTFKANPTWLNLRVGWGNPSKMNDAAALTAMAKKVAPHRQALGILESWLQRKVTKLPHNNVEQRWEALMNRFEYDPGSKGL